MSGEYFSQPSPEDPIEGPQIPERYWQRNLADLYPDTIVYPRASTVAVNEKNNQLYIKLKTTLDQSAYEWKKSTYDIRIGVMRLYLKSETGQIIDGYIADIRTITNLHEIERTSAIKEPDEQDRFYSDYQGHAKLLGVVYTTEAGQNCYSADPLLYTQTQDAAQMLAQHMDRLVQPAPQPEPPKAEEKVETLASPKAVEVSIPDEFTQPAERVQSKRRNLFGKRQ